MMQKRLPGAARERITVGEDIRGADINALIHLICHMPENLVGLELGTYRGESLVTLLQSCSNIKLLHSCDNYEPFEDCFTTPYTGEPDYIVDKIDQEYNEMFAGLNKPSCDITIAMLDELVEKEKKAKQNLEELKEKKEENLKHIIKPEPINFNTSTETIEKFEQELLYLEKKSFDLKADFAIKKKQAEQIRDDFKYKINRIPEIKASAHREAKQIKNLISEKEHIESQKCPTCLQKWMGNSAKDKIKNIISTIDSKKQKILELKPSIEEEAALIKKLAYIEKAIKDVEESSPYKKLDDLISEKKHDILVARTNNQSKITKLENEHLKKMAEYNSSISKIKEDWDKKIKQAEYNCFNIFAEYKEKNGKLNL